MMNLRTPLVLLLCFVALLQTKAVNTCSISIPTNYLFAMRTFFCTLFCLLSITFVSAQSGPPDIIPDEPIYPSSQPKMQSFIQPLSADEPAYYPEPIPASPNAAALEKYEKIPVGYHTGVPQVSVPLGEVTDGSLGVPIGLSYHAVGLKVLENSSWIGAGWTLTSSGAITRSVQGLPDEKQAMGRSFNQFFGYYDDLGFAAHVNDDEKHSDFGEKGFNKTIGDGEVDAEPDRYVIQVPGFSGKFYFADDQSVVFPEASDVKVVPYKGNDGGFERWEVILPNGTRYTFAQQVDEDDPITERMFTYREEEGIGANFRAAVSSWLLTEIVSADQKDVITYHYVPERYGYHTLVPSVGSRGQTPTRVKYSVEGWRLSEIRHTHGKVVFRRAASPRQDLSGFSKWSGGDGTNSEAYALQAIEWQDRSGNCVRKVELTTSYFEDDTPGDYFQGAYQVSSDRKRLKLDQVQETGCGELSKPPYVFAYYQETEVPRRLSYAQDHWGFFNGEVDNEGLLPNGTAQGPQRESGFPAMQAGTLQQIRYPTGGSTTFTYEANTVWRSYERTSLAETPTAIHQTSGLQAVSKNVTLPRGEYVIAYTVSSQQEQSTVYLEGLPLEGQERFGGSFSQRGTTYSDVVILEGKYQLRAQVGNDNYTSGKIEIFAYETNQYEEDFAVGGLRIKQIVRNPTGSGKELFQRFEYTKNNPRGSGKVSSAALYGRPVYRSYVRNDYIKQAGDRASTERELHSRHNEGCLLGGNPDATTLTSINGIFPMEEVQGYHLGYEVVTEYEPDGGHTIYNFNTSSTDSPTQPIAVYALGELCSAETPNYPLPPPAYNPRAGRLLQKIVKGADGNNKQIIVYNDVFKAEAEKVPGMTSAQVGNAPLINFYELSSHKLTSQTVTTYQYDQSDPSLSVTTVAHTKYESDKHAMPTASTVEVKSGTRRQQSTYVSDLVRTLSHQSSYDTYQGTLQANRNEFSQTTSPTNDCDFSTGCWYFAFKKLERQNFEARATYNQARVNERTQWQTNLDNDYTGASKEVQALINRHANNQLGQPVETALYLDNTMLEARYQSFQDKQTARNDQVSEVYPAKTFLIKQTTAFSPVQVSGGSLSKDQKYKLHTSLRYQQGRLVEALSRSGVTTAYLWGYKRKLPVAKVVGTSYNVVKAAVDPGSVQNLNGAELRSALSTLYDLGDTQVTTYTHDPLVGIISETDPDKRTTTYHYDDLNRLEWIESPDKHVVQKLNYYYDPSITADQ